MKKTYTVTGMTCDGCKASVEGKLKALEHIKNASVNLEKEEVEIDMSQPIPIEQLQESLSGKYGISEKEEINIIASSTDYKANERSEIRQLLPLFLIFGYLFTASFLLNRTPWDLQGFMFDFMGLFYIVFSFFKLLDLRGFPESFKMYDPLAKAIPVYAWIYPLIEIALGLMFLMRFKIQLALIITLIVLGLTTIGVSKTLLNKKSIQCACLGTALKLPMTKATFIENSIMIAMAIFMLLQTNN